MSATRKTTLWGAGWYSACAFNYAVDHKLWLATMFVAAAVGFLWLANR